jgi:hypothetical protein
MADIAKEMKKVVDAFGWDVNLLNGFWISIGKSGADFKGSLVHFNQSAVVYCNSVSLPSVGIEYEEVSIGVNKFKAFVPKNRIKGELTLTITGGTKDYLTNIKNMFNATDFMQTHDITVWLFTANFSNVCSAKYKNCLLKSIGEVGMEQSNSMSFFKCNYVFTVGSIDPDPAGADDSAGNSQWQDDQKIDTGAPST